MQVFKYIIAVFALGSFLIIPLVRTMTNWTAKLAIVKAFKRVHTQIIWVLSTRNVNNV